VAFQVFSTAFDDQGRLPVRHTADGADRSPPLAWSDPPPGTAAFALVCEDPDAPGGTWFHWALYDIPASVTSLPEGPPAGVPGTVGKASVNDFGRPGYGGPAPPPADPPHRYRFRVLAVGVDLLPLGSRPSARDVARAAARHLLAEASIVAWYGRDLPRVDRVSR